MIMKYIKFYLVFLSAWLVTTVFADNRDSKIIVGVTGAYVKKTKELAVKIEQEHDVKLVLLDKKIKRYKNDFENTEYFFYINEDNIFKAGLIFQLLLDLQNSYSGNLRSLQTNISLLNNYREELTRCLDKLKNIQKRKIFFKELQPQVNSLEKSLLLIKNRKQKLNGYLLKLGKLNKKYQIRLDAAEKIIERNCQQLPVMQQEPVYSKYFWEIIFSSSVRSWFYSIKHSFALQIPKEKSTWLLLILSLTFGALPLYILIKKIVFKKISADFLEHNDNSKLLARGIFLMITGLSIFSAKFYTTPLEIQLLELIALLMISMGILDLSWVIRRKPEKKKLIQPFTSFFILYTIAMFLRFSGAKDALIAIALLPTLTVVGFCLVRKLKIPYSSFDKTLIFSILFFCIAYFGLIVCGFYSFVVVLILIAFLTLNGILLGIAFASLAHNCAENDENVSGTRLFLVVLGIPLIWILLINFFTYLIADLFHVRHLVMRYIYTEVSWNGIGISIMEIAQCIILFFIVRALVYTVYLICKLKTGKDDNDIQHPLGAVISYALWALYVLFVLKIVGVNYTSIMVVLGGMSVGVGFALQHIVENFISGLILIFGKELRPGNVIELKNFSGTITKVNIRATVLRTRENSLITIPNSLILSSEVKNWSLNRKNVRSEVSISIKYGENIENIKKFLLESANSTEQVMDKPAPQVKLVNFGDHAMIFSLRIWIKSVWKRSSVQSDLREKIAETFHKNKIEFAFQHLDVCLVNEKEVTVDDKN
jgi:potassium-dependent mechanosensitive channel